jgi:type IV secretory pathway TrbD component
MVLGVPRKLIPFIFVCPALLISLRPTWPFVLVGIVWFVLSGWYVRWAVAIDPEYFTIQQRKLRRPRFFDPGKRERSWSR